jgi:GNAT superfamily N-acetyltransferase
MRGASRRSRRFTAAATLTAPMALPEDQRSERARAWHDDAMREVCNSIVEWEHGAVLRAAHYPTYWKYNHVRVDGDPRMTCGELIAFADEALNGYAHRRIEFSSVEPGDRLRGDFERRGWRAMRSVWMRHEQPPLLSAYSTVTVVPYDAVSELRVAWFHEDFPGQEPGEFLNYQRETAERRGARVLAVVEDDAPVGYAQVEYAGSGAEIASVYVLPDYRGGGRGTAVTLAAIASAAEAEDLWILADDEDRPKQLYERLGFRSAWTTMEFLRVPEQLRD